MSPPLRLPLPEPRKCRSAFTGGALKSAVRYERPRRVSEAHQHLSAFASQLDELSVAEEADAQRCCVRLEHLAALGTPLKDHAIDWNRRRMDRLLVDHLLRCGYMTTAMELAREAGIEARAARLPEQYFCLNAGLCIRLSVKVAWHRAWLIVAV